MCSTLDPAEHFQIKYNQVINPTLDSGIDVGQGIKVETEKISKRNKCMALNKSRAWKIWVSYHVEKKNIEENVLTYVVKKSNLKISKGLEKITKINKRRAYVYSVA